MSGVLCTELCRDIKNRLLSYFYISRTRANTDESHDEFYSQVDQQQLTFVTVKALIQL